MLCERFYTPNCHTTILCLFSQIIGRIECGLSISDKSLYNQLFFFREKNTWFFASIYISTCIQCSNTSFFSSSLWNVSRMWLRLMLTKVFFFFWFELRILELTLKLKSFETFFNEKKIPPKIISFVAYRITFWPTNVVFLAHEVIVCWCYVIIRVNANFESSDLSLFHSLRPFNPMYDLSNERSEPSKTVFGCHDILRKCY